MNIETVEDEVYEFIDSFFDQELYLIDVNLDFIEDNKLLSTKIDYTHMHDFLSDILNKFENIDSSFAPSTVKKLNYDIRNIEKTFNNFLKKTKSPKEVFKNSFLQNSQVLNYYAETIVKFEKSKEKSSDDFLDIKHMKKNLVSLKNIYYPVFEDIFLQNVKEITKDFKYIINTKNFYLDRMVWKYASASHNIVKHMQIRKMEGDFNAKSYLTFVMSMMRPYTDEYKYLEKCLKVYR
jgi:hypothetical protein